MSAMSENAAAEYLRCAFVAVLKTNTSENVQKHQTHGCSSCSLFFFSLQCFASEQIYLPPFLFYLIGPG